MRLVYCVYDKIDKLFPAMGIYPQRILLMLACVGILFLTRAAFCEDDMEFSSDPFFSDSTVVAVHKKWHLRLGGGGSFFVSKYKGHIPSITGFFLENSGQDFLIVNGVSSVPTDVELQSAGEFEGALTRDVTPSLSVGLMGGSSTGHNAGINLAQAYPGVQFYSYGKPISVEFRAELRASKIMPMVQYGPRYNCQNVQLRPYVLGAAGIYQVAQTAYIVLDENTEEASGNTAYYSGAAVGFGLNCTFHQSYTTALEGRYERVFSPGQTLAFWVPTVVFGYLF